MDQLTHKYQKITNMKSETVSIDIAWTETL